MPVQQPAPPPRITAPIVSVAAPPIAAPQPGTNWIGESVARAARAQAGSSPQAPAYTPASIVQASAPAPAPQPPPPQAGTVSGSVLGGSRTALPPPVPYGAR